MLEVDHLVNRILRESKYFGALHRELRCQDCIRRNVSANSLAINHMFTIIFVQSFISSTDLYTIEESMEFCKRMSAENIE